MQSFEPIAAVSTPYGRGGIAVIRMSGEGAVALAAKLFFPKSGRMLSEMKHANAVYGEIYYRGRKIDDGIATVFYAPHSYTGEDTVEVSCHGGIVLTETVLAAAFECGFKAARGGEYTKRAFLNGKLSLSQAEAVIGLIEAENEEQLRLSSSLASGVLSRNVDALSAELTDILASVYAYIDYPDEDLTEMCQEQLLKKTEQVLYRVRSLCDSYKAGKAVNEGIKTVIVGKPNAGKSSILNRLLGYDRAIVTSLAGTTRDTVEESVSIGGVMLRLCDTAGIRDSQDEVEKLGIKRSIEKLNDADLIVAVFDGSSSLDEMDADIINRVLQCKGEVVSVINKADSSSFSLFPLPFPKLIISAETGEGFEELKKYISGLFIQEKLDYDMTPVISNARQYAAASSAENFLENAVTALKDGFTQDIAGMDIESALGKLKELDGKNVTEEITDRIFSRFCVGK